AAAALLRIKAQPILLAAPHLTPASALVAPTRIMAPAIVCVVLTRMPSDAVAKRVDAAAVSALKPPKGWSLVIFIPMARTIPQPPNHVPRPMATPAIITT